MYNFSYQPIKVLALVAHTHATSVSQLAVVQALQGCQKEGIQANIISLNDIRFNNSTNMEHMDIVYLRKLVEDADTIIFCSPEHDNKCSIQFQQTFQFLEPYGILKNKVVACIGIGNSISPGGAYALVNLLDYCKEAGALPLAASLFIPMNEVIWHGKEFIAFSKVIFTRLELLGSELIFNVRQLRIHQG